MNKNQISILKKSNLLGIEFTIYGTAENPLFLAKDVAEMIGHSNVSKMLSMIDKDEKVKIFCNLPQEGTITKGYKPCESATYYGANRMFVTEDGLYEILMQSNLPIAKEFKKGVKTILKEIRKNGGYIATSEEDDAEMILAKALKVADATIKRKEQQLLEQKQQIDKHLKTINKMKPLAEYCSEVLQSDSTYTLTQVSKDLGFKSVYKFLDWANKNILYKQSNQWMPTAKYSDKGLFRTRTTKYFKSDGTIGTKMSTVVTEKGREFLHNIISNNK